MKQRWLPGFDGPELEDEAAFDLDHVDLDVEEDTQGVPPLPGQAGLFTAERELIGLMEAAVVEGRFEEARRFRDTLVALEGASREARRLSVLDRLGLRGFWERPIEQCVDEWHIVERSLANEDSAAHRLVRSGFLARLITSSAPEAIVRLRPAMLALLVNFLAARDGDSDRAGSAESLLRDALAAGMSAASGGFDEPALVDLLAEDRAPQWLACLGAVRRLWPVPPLDTGSATVPPDPPPDGDEERGAQFWHCLRVAVSCARDSVPGEQARKRMKLLDAALHAQFMRQGVRRE